MPPIRSEDLCLYYIPARAFEQYIMLKNLSHIQRKSCNQRDQILRIYRSPAPVPPRTGLLLKHIQHYARYLARLLPASAVQPAADEVACARQEESLHGLQRRKSSQMPSGQHKGQRARPRRITDGRGKTALARVLMQHALNLQTHKHRQSKYNMMSSLCSHARSAGHSDHGDLQHGGALVGASGS